MTKKYKEWLKERERIELTHGLYSCAHCFHRSDELDLYHGYCTVIEDGCLMVPDYKDAAEFEALVAAKMTRVTVGDLPCGIDPDNNDCQKPHFEKYNTKERAVGCDMCFIMTARIAVEEEMEADNEHP